MKVPVLEGSNYSDHRSGKPFADFCFFPLFRFSVRQGAMYLIYSINHPAIQNYQQNALLYVKGEDLMIGPTGQYFIAHVPGFSRDRNTISLESYCKRGYFLRQKKYGFMLRATHASLNFGKYSVNTS